MTPGLDRRATRLAAGDSRHAIDNELRSRRATAPYRGVILSANVELDAAARAAAALLTQDPLSAASHRTAAVLTQLPWVPGAWGTGEDACELAVPADDKHRQRSGLLLRQGPLPPDQVVMAAGVRVTSPARTLVDLVRDGRVGRADGLAMLDGALRQRLCTKRDLQAVIGSLAGRRGIVRARELTQLAREGVDSPGESHFRLGLLDAGIRDEWIVVPVCVRDHDGLLAARGDFGHEELMLWGEYDGYDEHVRRETFRKDRAGDRWLHDRGWYGMRFTADDTRAPGRAARHYLRAMQEAPARIFAERQYVSPELARARAWLTSNPEFVRDLRSLRLDPPRPAFAGGERRSRR